MSKIRLASTAAAVAVMVSVAFTSPAHATVPARNGLIAFAGSTGGAFQIDTVRPNGHDLQQLTHVNGDAIYPAWSPNGHQIAYELDHPDGPIFSSIILMNADGTNMIDLTTDKNPPGFNGGEGTPSFTPDGSRIVFERYDAALNDDAIYSMNLRGQDWHRITAGIGFGASAPEVSPNGTKLAFVGGNGQDFGAALFTSSIDGSNLHQLTPFSFDLSSKVNWAPDGRHLVMTVNADHPHPTDSANIATIDADGTDLRYLTHYTGGQVNAIAGSYSPDGKWIVFRLEDHGQFALYRMRSDGSQLHAILPLSNLKPRSIDWGPAPDR